MSRHLDVRDLPSQGPARSEISALLAASSVDEEVVGDVLVVVSELVANAFEHGRATSVSVDVTVVDADSVELVVTHHEDDPRPVPGPATMPAPDAHRGRGLALVVALTSRYENHVVGGRVTTRCTVGRPRGER